MAKDKGKSAAPAPHDHEERDIPVRTIGMWIGGLFGGLLLVMLLCHVAYRFQPSHGEGELVRTRKMTDPPLQPQPNEEMAEFRAAELEHLSGYGWADKAKGTVYIPIEQAIELALKRGYPVRSQH